MFSSFKHLSTILIGCSKYQVSTYLHTTACLILMKFFKTVLNILQVSANNDYIVCLGTSFYNGVDILQDALFILFSIGFRSDLQIVNTLIVYTN